MTKRILSLLLAAMMMLSFAACDEETTPSTEETEQTTPDVPEEDGVFTLGWVSDPQWYAFAYPDILTKQNDWIAENYKDLDMQYLLHTGDLVGEPHDLKQWEFVSGEYKKWDDAGLRYGVLAGNHDVDGTDRTEFQQYFGEERYNQNEWYGESYDDNRGHYDLVTLGGVDFIFTYLGYGSTADEDFAWLNAVLAEYPTRIAMLCFHDYLKVDATRSSTGEKLFNDVVLKNPNVRAVFCGHNYNATRRVDDIDDNGDGAPDRSVFQLMANYQDLENGGNGFFRLMECDVNEGTIRSKTYSPYLNQYNAFDNSDATRDEYGYQDEFVIPFDFTAPVAKEKGDPAVGTVTVNSRVSFVGDTTFTVPVTYLNTAEDGDTFQNAGIYDATFSLTATDAFADCSSLTFVTVTYADEEGYRIADIVKGDTLTEDSMVPIPQTGVVVALSADAVDKDGNPAATDTLEIGQVVTFNQVYGIASPVIMMSKYLTFPWGVDYRISSTNRKVGGDQWILLDSTIGDSAGDTGDTHEWNVLFCFSPTDKEGTFVISEVSTESGVAKDPAIPAGGFIMAINTVSSGSDFPQSMRDYFTVGTEVTLTGYTPK